MKGGVIATLFYFKDMMVYKLNGKESQYELDDIYMNILMDYINYGTVSVIEKIKK